MTSRFSVVSDAGQRPIGSAGSRQGEFIQGGIPFNPPNCQGTTKAGVPCTARRAMGTMLCIGHLRSKGTNVDPS